MERRHIDDELKKVRQVKMTISVSAKFNAIRARMAENSLIGGEDKIEEKMEFCKYMTTKLGLYEFVLEKAKKDNISNFILENIARLELGAEKLEIEWKEWRKAHDNAPITKNRYCPFEREKMDKVREMTLEQRLELLTNWEANMFTVIDDEEEESSDEESFDNEYTQLVLRFLLLDFSYQLF